MRSLECGDSSPLWLELQVSPLGLSQSGEESPHSKESALRFVDSESKLNACFLGAQRSNPPDR